MDLKGLNEAQREAVKHTEGPVMILAGAGSGKTRTLVTRISYILQELNISPFQVLGLTFSNKAAKEMRERISSMVALDIGALQITTFHAFCARVLRSEATYIGLSRSFTIYDTSESKAVMKAILQRRGISSKEISPYDVLYFIDGVKNVGHYPQREFVDPAVDVNDEFYDFYQEYESELHRANAVDFGGLICGVIQLFEKYPEVLQRYQSKFKYVLIDEYQDTNRAQFELVKMLCEKNHNVCAVGDEDQSIYSWRGADIRNILDFEAVFPNVKVLKLEQNYRSSKTIIDAASCVIERNALRKGKKMWTANPEGDVIQIIECPDDKQEALFVAEETLELVKNGASFSDIAVFYRTNAQSRLVEDYLRQHRIAYRVVGGVKFYDRKEIKDILAYMRLLVNSQDSLALSRIINVPARGVGATTLRKLEEEAIATGISLWEMIVRVTQSYEDYKFLKVSSKVQSALHELVSLIEEIRKLQEDRTLPSELYEKILYGSGYLEHLKARKDYESQARVENLQELESAIKQFEEVNPNPTLIGFLETITLDANVEEDALSTDYKGEVSLMTVHGAKGLEFNHVFVLGAEENIFPSYRSIEAGEIGTEEERRLFYVAMTRAMKSLYITFAQGRMLFGQIKFNGPSRFLYEIPDKLYKWKKCKSKKQNDWDDQDRHYEDFGHSYEPEIQVQTNHVYQSKFARGSKVVHSLYGEGLVLETEGRGVDEKVVVRFHDGAKKKFMVKFAPLAVI